MTEAGHAEVGREWWFRAWAERDSARRFARLQEAMVAQAVPRSLCDACGKAQADEDRHAVLCAEVARRFRPDDPYADTPALGEALGPGQLEPGERLLYEMVAFCAVTESLNASLLLTVFGAAREPGVREATQALLRDEVTHAQLGWAYLAYHARERGSPAFLGPRLERILEATVSESLVSPEAYCARWSDPALGYLPRSERVRVFLRGLRTVVLPGLAWHGVATEDADRWLSSQPWTQEAA